jgi:hypothetical protein
MLYGGRRDSYIGITHIVPRKDNCMSQPPPPPETPDQQPPEEQAPPPKPNVVKTVALLAIVVVCLVIAGRNVYKKMNTPSDEAGPPSVPRQAQ